MTANFGKFVHTNTGKMIMSVLIGFGLATLFRTACKGQRCRLFRAPPLGEFADKIYKSEGGGDNRDRCVKYNPVATKCTATGGKRVLSFEEFSLMR